MSVNSEKIALISGAAGTLGAATAKGLLADGLRVVLVDLNSDKLSAVAKQLPGETYQAVFDISNPAEVETFHTQIVREFGNIDILVNNAGILTNNKSQDTTPEEWQKLMRVNVDGAFFLSRICIPYMKSVGWGRIINTCSLAGKNGGLTAGTAYATSKGALMSLTFSLAVELASFGITVNGIAPAYVRTPMVTEQLSAQERQAVLRKIPVGRFCEPEEFVHVVRFLISPLAGFITGEIIDQNGCLMTD